MSWANRLQERLDEWGKAAFAHEVEINFKRAQIFDGKFARITLDTLCQFSKDDLRILGNILPVSNLELHKSLPDRERQLLDAFKEKVKQQTLNRREQLIKEAGLTLKEPLATEAAEIRHRAPAVFKKIAQRLECEIHKVEPRVWMLSRRELWGEIRMPFDLHEALQFFYFINIEDNDYRRVLEHDSYLRRLGFTSSAACRLTSADMFAEKMEQVTEIIEWQLNEYRRIIQPLEWPRIEPFSAPEKRF